MNFLDMERMGRLLLEKVHTHLLSLYVKINIKEEVNHLELHSDITPEFFTQATHVTLLEHGVGILKDEDETKPERGYHSQIPSIRVQRFLDFMKREHGCKVEPGKGSEIKVWRPGTRIYTIGCHKRNPKIPTWLIRQVLRRLEISDQNWLLSLDQL